MKFTWQDKFTRIAEKLPDDLLAKLMRAVMAYGTDGIEPELEFPLDALFEGFREDIDYSKGARQRGARGGRRKDADPVSSADEPESADAEPLTSHSEVLSSGTEPLESGAEVLPSHSEVLPSHSEVLPSHSNTRPSSTEQSSTEESEGRARKRFARPTRSEVEAYAHEIGLPPGEVPKWFDHYDACGWVVGRNKPMRDWKAALRNWKARLHEFSGKEATEHDRYSEL